MTNMTPESIKWMYYVGVSVIALFILLTIDPHKPIHRTIVELFKKEK